MKYLLDTCVLIWSLEDNQAKLGSLATIIKDLNNEIFVSVISYWEITIKSSLGKLEIAPKWAELIDETGFIWLNLIPKHLSCLENLPMIHNDLFDRLLISQAQTEQMKLLTLDKKVLQYDSI
jgi:PIN domain nuclease of toxin-antitoxin system